MSMNTLWYIPEVQSNLELNRKGSVLGVLCHAHKKLFNSSLVLYRPINIVSTWYVRDMKERKDLGYSMCSKVFIATEIHVHVRGILLVQFVLLWPLNSFSRGCFENAQSP